MMYFYTKIHTIFDSILCFHTFYDTKCPEKTKHIIKTIVILKRSYKYHCDLFSLLTCYDHHHMTRVKINTKIWYLNQAKSRPALVELQRLPYYTQKVVERGFCPTKFLLETGLC